MDLKSNRKDVAIVGFYGSGSSALIDFLREFDNCGIALDKDIKGRHRPYEHFPFISSGGLFELGALVTNINSAYSSDMIFNNFIDCSKRLNDNNFVSFGSYKWLLGDKFMQATYDFLEELGVKEMPGIIAEHKQRTKFSLVMVFLQFAAKIVYHRPVYRWGKKNIYDKNKSLFCMPSNEKFFNAAKNYINAYFDMCAQENKEIMIYDQLICPQHSELINKYFDDNFKSIMVLRDARDIYSLSKYFWSKPPYGVASPLPNDIHNFVDYWSKTTDYNKNVKNTLTVNFEDLVYKYDETTKNIMNFLELDKKNHISKFKYFNPELSIKNTQTFLLSDEKAKEAETIAQLMPQCIYNFPYKIQTSYKEMFDDCKEVIDKNKKTENN